MSIYTQFISLRDKISDIAYDNNEFVANLFSNISKSDSTQFQGITLSVDQGQMYISDAYQDKHFNIEKVSDHLTDVFDNVDGDSYSLSDILTSISASGDLYSLLGSITAKFSYCSRMTLTDVNQLIDSFSSSNPNINYSVSNLKDQLVAVSNDEGYITSKSWLISMNNWFKQAEDGAANDTPALDETNPFVLSGVYNIVAGIASTVASVIFGALASIFGAVALTIGSLISNVFSSIANYYNSGGSVDPNAPNLFVKGPISYWKMNPFWYHGGDTLYDSVLNSNPKGIFFFENAGIASFLWKDPNTHADYYNNSYLYPCFHPQAAKRWFNDLYGYHVIDLPDGNPDNVAHSHIVKIGTCSAFPLNTDAEDAEIGSSINVAMQAICVDAFVRWLVCDNELTDDPNSYSGKPFIDWNATSSASSNASWWKKRTNAIIKGMLIIKGLRYHDNPTYYVSDAYIVDAAIYLMQDLYAYGGEPLKENLVCDYPGDNAYNGKISLSEATIVSTSKYILLGIRNGISQEWADKPGNTITTIWGSKVIETDCLPTSWYLTMNSLTVNDTINAIVITSLAAIATAVLTLKVSKAIRLKKIKKQTLRTNHIETLKQNYLDDPTNKVKANAYAREVDRFNRMGRILGWGSYDAANGWINSPADSPSGNLANSDGVVSTTNAVKTLLLGDSEEPSVSAILSSLAEDISSLEEHLTRVELLIYNPNN